MSRMTFIVALVLIAIAGSVAAQEEDLGSGQVQLPLDQYDTLVNASRNPDDPEAPAPADYALGTGQPPMASPPPKSSSSSGWRCSRMAG